MSVIYNDWLAGVLAHDHIEEASTASEDAELGVVDETEASPARAEA